MQSGGGPAGDLGVHAPESTMPRTNGAARCDARSPATVLLGSAGVGPADDPHGCVSNRTHRDEGYASR